MYNTYNNLYDKTLLIRLNDSDTIKKSNAKRGCKMISNLITNFNNIFGEGGDIRTYFAPGRVNLIGEHTDYNGGHVFPCALTIGTYLVARKREDRLCRMFSLNFQDVGIIEKSINDLIWTMEVQWGNYPLGVIWAFGQKGYEVTNGFDILLYGNIPNGSGLSSSASVEVGMGVLLKDMLGFDITMQEIALIGQFAENKFNKVNCGIMDQFAIAMGKVGQAIFLDTATLKYKYAPIKLEDAKIVIACTNKKRKLEDSKYNERRKECEDALAQLQSVIDIRSLGDLTQEKFEENKCAIQSETHTKRARHAVYENQRTIKAVDVLEEGDIAEFGRLMIESHNSLRDDYEVTGVELDTLVDAALKHEGVIGSRMTGAGFGGCTVNIVRNDCIDSFIENVGTEYKNIIGYEADFYVVEVGGGARRIFEV